MSITKHDGADGVKPFEIIECPVCGLNNFTDNGPGSGVYCDECGTQFKVRACGGDAGCVVDALFDDVYNSTGTAGKRAYRRALKDLGFYVEAQYPHVDPIWTAMRIMKCPDEYGCSLDDRGWSLAPTRYHPKPSDRETYDKFTETLTAPIVGRYGALRAGEAIEREESERDYERELADRKREADATSAV